MPATAARSAIMPLASTSLLLLSWHICALLLNSPLLPTPVEVYWVFIESIYSGELPHHLMATLKRLAISFFLAMTIGSAVGIYLGRHTQANAFFDSWLIVLLNIPALVTIILCYIWLGLIEAAAIFAVVINKLPNVAVTLREGARNLDTQLLGMAQVYQFGKYKTLRHVILPQLYPYFLASARTGLALIWKIILVVELLGCSSGMGFQLHLFFQFFDITSILAYTLSFILVIQLIEFIILKPLDRHAQRWK